MPLFMDVHHLGNGVRMGGLAPAHQADLAAEAANDVDRRAHGLVADDIYQVQEGV